MNKRIAFNICALFILLGSVMFINEMYDLPTLLFGLAATSANWVEYFVEIFLAACIGIYVINMLNYNITKRKIIEAHDEELAKEVERLKEELSEKSKELESLKARSNKLNG